MKALPKRYKNLFTLATLQFDGHLMDYYKQNAEKLVAFYLLPRSGDIKNFVAYYHNGALIEKKELFSPKHIVFAYIFYYLEFLYILFRYFPRNEKFFFLNSQPIFFFFRSLIRLFWRVEYVYWVGDYWPMNALSIQIFRFFMHYFHDTTRYTLYLSDRINQAMNYGKITSRSGKETVMWGMKPPTIYKKMRRSDFVTLCFVGVLAEWQGIDVLLAVVGQHEDIRLKLIGTGKLSLMKYYQDLIHKYHVEDRVFFPNKFYYGGELEKAVQDADIGVALYDTDPATVTYYADPAKIKQYAEYGMPIIMTDAADIARYVTKFRAGIVVRRDPVEIVRAIEEIRHHYPLYRIGLKKFNDFFNYREYYSRKLKFLEQK